MKRLIIMMMALLLLSINGIARNMTYERTDSIRIVELLQKGRSLKRGDNVPLFFARQLIGLPYVASTLEVNNREQLVINLRQMDCTTLVENVTVLTRCIYQKRYSFCDFVANLKRTRYRNGEIIDYTSRLHYYSDWIIDNERKGVVTEVKTPNPPFRAVQTLRINYMSTHADSYLALRNQPEYVKKIARQEKILTGQKFRYIPKSDIDNSKLLRSTIHDGDIIAITCNKAGLDIAHLGFAVWHRDGLHLLNASSIHHQVTEEPMLFRNYLIQHPSHTGVRILRIK